MLVSPRPQLEVKASSSALQMRSLLSLPLSGSEKESPCYNTSSRAHIWGLQAPHVLHWEPPAMPGHPASSGDQRNLWSQVWTKLLWSLGRYLMWCRQLPGVDHFHFSDLWTSSSSCRGHAAQTPSSQMTSCVIRSCSEADPTPLEMVWKIYDSRFSPVSSPHASSPRTQCCIPWRPITQVILITSCRWTRVRPQSQALCTPCQAPPPGSFEVSRPASVSSGRSDKALQAMVSHQKPVFLPF